jgi:hypothetical protein
MRDRDAGVNASRSCHRTGRTFEDDRLDMPIVLLAALAECDVTLAGFIDRILHGSVWQDEAIRSADRRVVVQAHLAAEGLRSLVQIGETTFYHADASMLHLLGLILPATILAMRDLPAATLICDPLFQLPGIVIRRLRPLDRRDPAMGTAVLLHVPTITVWLPQT